MTEFLWLTDIFIALLNMSVTAGIVIVGVLVLRLGLKKAPKIFSYALWAIVLFRLLCPFSFSAPVSLLGMLQAPAAQQGRITYITNTEKIFDEEDAGGQTNELPGVANPVSDGVVATEGEMHISSEVSTDGRMVVKELLLFLGAVLWAVGAAVLLGYCLVSSLRLRSRLKAAVHIEQNIYTHTSIAVPFVCGIIRPRIYLPVSLAEEEREYVLLHERIHIQRKDHIFRLLAFLALSMHWFNPLVWLAFYLSERDMEMSCDEAVIRRLGGSGKKEYSASLLNLAAGRQVLDTKEKQKGRLSIGGMPLAFSEGNTGSRIKNVLRYRKPTKMVLAALLVLGAAAAVVLLANPGEDTEALGQEVNEQQLYDGETANSDGDEVEEQQQAHDREKEADASANGENQQQGDANPGDESQEDSPASTTYQINIRTLNREARVIDTYVGNTEVPSSFDGGGPITIAENCVFWANYEMDKVAYEEISYDTFADIISQGSEYLGKPAMLTFEDGLVVEAVLKTAYDYYGIGFSQKYSSTAEFVWLQEQLGEAMLQEYFTLASTETKDISDAPGAESIEVYTGYVGEGDDSVHNTGLVLFKNARGEVLHCEYADLTRVSWNNIYLGEVEGLPFIMTLHIEDRGDYGIYNYEVFRLSEEGEINQLAGSYFEWTEGYLAYDADLFEQWMEKFSYYFDNTYLVLSSQEGEQLRTEKISEAERYSLEKLRRDD